MPASIRQVAKAAGVSITTVSNVINNKGSMGVETRQRVQHVIADLGYRRKNQCGGSIAFITGLSGGFGHNWIAQAAAENGFSVQVVMCSDQLDVPPDFEFNRKIAGAVVFGGRWKPAFLAQIITAYPTVLMGSSLPTYQCDAVWVDNAGGIYAAVDYLIRQGHRRIGLINGPENSVTSAEKQIGFARALRQAGLQDNGVEIQTANFSFTSGQDAAHRLLDRQPRPSAIIAGESAYGFATLDVCTNLGLQIPNDVSIITFHDDPRFEQSKPPITGINIPELAICRVALSHLSQRINNPKAPGQRVLLQPELIMRNSVCPPR